MSFFGGELVGSPRLLHDGSLIVRNDTREPGNHTTPWDANKF